MYTGFKKVVMLVSLALVAVSFALSTAIAYDRYAARDYAERWVQPHQHPEDQKNVERNPAYNDYSDSGGDCANFASQCLIAGGLDLTVEDYYSWCRDEHNCYWKCVGLDDELWWGHYYDINYSYDDWSGSGRSWMRIGDIMIFGYADDDPRHQEWADYFKHAAVVASGYGTSVLMNAHTSERYHRPLDFFFPSSQFSTVNYYHICGWAKPVASASSAPSEFSLEQNVPNPFNSSTVISFSLPTATSVKLNIYNLLGQNIRTLLDGMQSQGVHSVVWDGKDSLGQDVASGIYLYRLEVSGFVQTKKMLLLR